LPEAGAERGQEADQEHGTVLRMVVPVVHQRMALFKAGDQQQPRQRQYHYRHP